MNPRLVFFALSASLWLAACTTVPPNVDLSDAALARERRTRATLIADKIIEAEASEELNAEDDIRERCHVNVHAYNGAVLVTGEAATPELGKKVIATVQGIDNIKLIHNNLSITEPADPSSRAHDADITETVTTALKQIRSIPHFDPGMVNVITENGIVYLMGAVHRNEGSVVVNVTRLQPDIKQIITIFQYLD